MAKRNDYFIPVKKQTEQETKLRKSFVHSQYTVTLNEGDNSTKLKCNYCNKTNNAHSGGNKEIVADFPATPVYSATKLKHDVAQASVVE